MKTLMIAVVMAASTLGGMAAATTASAQPYGRYWHERPYGHRWHAWRRDYYGRHHRYPARVCRHTPRGPVCFYR